MVVVSATINCLYSHLLPALQNLLSPTIKYISWCHITESLMVATIVIVVDEVSDSLIQLAGELIG